MLGSTVALAAAAPARAASTLVVCTEASPDSLNAALSTANTSFDVTEQIADRLVEMEVGGSTLKPALAESWTISEDGLRYTFKLRRGVKFHSSASFKPAREFNADDVVFTYNRMLDHSSPWYKVGGSYDMFSSFIEPALQSVTKLDDHTVVLTLKKPSASFLNALSIQSLSIQSAEYAAAMEKAGTQSRLDQQPIGTGPFQLLQYQKDSLIRFRAFREFWGAGGGMPERAAKVDNLVFSITPDPAVRLAKLQANECQIARYPNAADLKRIRTTPNLTLQEATIASTSYLAMRTDHKPFDDVRVRRALAMAIDMKSLVEAVYQGTGTPAASLVPPSMWGTNADLKPFDYDPQAAKALLAEAGLASGFSTDLWAIPVARAYMPNGRRAAEMIQADWAKIGVTAKIVSFEWGEYLRRRRMGEGDVGMSGGTWDFPDPSQMVVSLTCENMKTGRNVANWCNQVYSDLVDKAGVLSDQSQRAALYQQAQQVLHDDVPVVFFADAKAFVALRSNVQGFKLHFLGGQPFGGVSVGD
ncbi:ABC transporter substrate-binding protein [Pseudoroseomonas wenyumeiae]|uniref:ABC transporter substrate-binding protein n=2 Tax=Teichococcus wenyumeiae TaxID=2478470 RepID=A0A3A9JYH4_9PROT|nr:ABC transporter substrate-binding protein [Pseudoroseomonas wenyumeiae]RMI17167.1 ABC transporter substrate-binding protein [Pseudoroseomonas wenyumeiae]